MDVTVQPWRLVDTGIPTLDVVNSYPRAIDMTVRLGFAWIWTPRPKIYFASSKPVRPT
jgi:hypothetical protein